MNGNDLVRIGKGPGSAPLTPGEPPALPRCAPSQVGRPDPRVATAAAKDPDPGAHASLTTTGRSDVIEMITVVCTNCGRPHCATTAALKKRPVCPYCFETVRQATIDQADHADLRRAA